MQCAVLYCRLWSAQLYNIFPHYLINGKKKKKKKILNLKCVLIFSTTFVWNISHSEKNWEIYVWLKMFIGLHVKYPLFSSDFNETWIFSTRFREMLKYKILWQFTRCGPSRSMRTDEQTDIKKLIVVFQNFANARTMLFYCRPHTEIDYFYHFFSFL
jgi:hypothetical protein